MPGSLEATMKSFEKPLRYLAVSMLAVGCLSGLKQSTAYTPAVYFGNAIETPPQTNQPAYAAWIGTDSTWGEAFIPHETWTHVETPDWVFSPWGKWNAAHPESGIFLGVPLFAEADMGNYA